MGKKRSLASRSLYLYNKIFGFWYLLRCKMLEGETWQ